MKKMMFGRLQEFRTPALKSETGHAEILRGNKLITKSIKAVDKHMNVLKTENPEQSWHGHGKGQVRTEG